MQVRLKLRHVLAAALAAGCGYVAAPALSAQPYIPEAVDFEQRLPSLSRLAEPSGTGPGRGRVSFKSPVIAAPEPFDLAGLARETRPLELRGRERGGEWTRWVETEDANPVYFGGGEELQVRTRGWRPSGTLH